MKIFFSDIELDCDLFELRKAGQLVHVEPKTFNLLAHLAQHPDVVFSNDELIDSVWKGRIVSDASVVSCIASARKAIGDSGGTQKFIKTVRGRGFRFVAETRVALPDLEPAGTSGPVLQGSESTVTQADPLMLIMPFRLSATAQQAGGEEYVQSLTGALEIVLMRIPLLNLSSYSLINPDPEARPSPQELCNHHGIDYLLEGSIQHDQHSVTLNVQLSELCTRTRLWAERFVVEGNFQSVLEASVMMLVAKLEPQLHRAMYNRARQSTSAANSRTLYLEASGMLALKGWHHNTFSSASDLLRRSWQTDPDFAQAASYLSLVLGLGCRLELLPRQENYRDEAIEAAEAALQIDDMNSSVLGLAGCALADLGFNERGLLILRNAVDLNPSNAQAVCALGGVCLTTRQVDTAIVHLKRGMKISPLDSRLSIWGGLLSTALRFKGEKDASLAEATLACQRDHQSYMARVILSGAHFSNDNLKAAKSALAEAWRIKPDLTDEQINCLLGRRLGNELTQACR